MKSKIAFLLALFLNGVLVPGVARAFEYSYEAPSECPSQRQFESKVAARLESGSELNGVERVAVSIVQTRDYQASFQLFEREYEPVTRTLAASDCYQAVQALALALALALEARRGPTDSPGGTSHEAPTTLSRPGSAVDSPPKPAPAAPPSRADHSPALPPPSVAPAAAPAPPRGFTGDTATQEAAASPYPAWHVTTRELELGARIGLFVGTGYSPRASFGPSMGVALAHGPLELWASAFYGIPDRVVESGLSARFFVLGARLEPCYALLFSHSIAGVGCANFEFAGVWAAGVNGNGIVNARRDVAPFWGVGATLGPRWRWGGSMSLEARGGLQRPLDPHRFRFSNRNDSLHEYPPLAFLAGASFAMAW